MTYKNEVTKCNSQEILKMDCRPVNRTRCRDHRVFQIKSLGNYDMVYLDGNLLFTVDYDGDFEVESVRRNVQHTLHNYLFIND